MWFQQAASWQSVQALTRRVASDEAELLRSFWRKILGLAASLPFAEDLLAAYYCAFDRQTPLHVKAVLVGALAYFILPDDLIPDYLPVIGYTDDAAVLAAAIKLVSSNMKPEHREAAQNMLVRLRGKAPSRP
ncbi:MAG TPA: YkvA family protein [Xanthobacteraceae bacterium]|nr:YkvA family protein [Xanthobacteraceae bacterium]